jgi:hypothetical protein
MGTLASVQAGFPFQQISIDFVGPLAASSKGNKYILTVKDCFTRWIEAFLIVAATALATVDILVKEIFAGTEYWKSYTQTEEISLLQTYFTQLHKSMESR